jgi:hypothetical protein
MGSFPRSLAVPPRSHIHRSEYPFVAHSVDAASGPERAAGPVEALPNDRANRPNDVSESDRPASRSRAMPWRPLGVSSTRSTPSVSHFSLSAHAPRRSSCAATAGQSRGVPVGPDAQVRGTPWPLDKPQDRDRCAGDHVVPVAHAKLARPFRQKCRAECGQSECLSGIVGGCLACRGSDRAAALRVGYVQRRHTAGDVARTASNPPAHSDKHQQGGGASESAKRSCLWHVGDRCARPNA